MDSAVLLVVLPPLVGAALAAWWMRRVMRATGWQEWARTARTLSWEDRRRVWRATSRGRALDDRRLAALVVQRGEHALALSRRVSPPLHWILATMGLLMLLAAVVLGLTGNWQLAGLLLAMLIVGIFNHVLMIKYTVNRIEQTVEENRRLLGG